MRKKAFLDGFSSRFVTRLEVGFGLQATEINAGLLRATNEETAIRLDRRFPGQVRRKAPPIKKRPSHPVHVPEAGRVTSILRVESIRDTVRRRRNCFMLR